MPAQKEAAVRLHLSRPIPSGRCGSIHVQQISAPVGVVWPLIRRFDRPQDYNSFVKSCSLSSGDGGVGSVRELRFVSGLPAARSTERLDELDDDRHVISYSILDGDHRLVNYRSTTSCHLVAGGGTVVVESFEVDVPAGNTEEETRIFVDTLITCNLRSLAAVTERIVRLEAFE